MHFLKQYPGRFTLMHVKVEIKRSAASENGSVYESTILGKGVVDVKGILTLHVNRV